MEVRCLRPTVLYMATDAVAAIERGRLDGPVVTGDLSARELWLGYFATGR